MKTLLLALLLALPAAAQCRTVIPYVIPQRPAKASFCGDRPAYRVALQDYHRGVRSAQRRARAQCRRDYFLRRRPVILRRMGGCYDPILRSSVTVRETK